MYHATMIMDLPIVIMVEIISRLSIKSIFCCKTVCKLWYNLLTFDTIFFNMYHTSKSPNFPCLLLLSNNASITFILELKANYDYFSSPLKVLIKLSIICPICFYHSFCSDGICRVVVVPEFTSIQQKLQQVNKVLN